MGASAPDRPIIAWHSPRFAGLLEALLAERSPVYVVGGAVRDHLLGRATPLTDLDLALAPPILTLARQVADRLGWAYYPLDRERDVARLVGAADDGSRLVCDMAALRGGIDDDLWARDFTVNALALELTPDSPPRLIDLCGGAADLAARRLRRVSEHSLEEDPIRRLRAVRLAAQLGFAIEAETRRQIQAQAGTVAAASPERVRDELWRLLATDAPAAPVEEMRRLGLLSHLLPEVAATVDVPQSPPHHLDVYRHTLRVIEQAAELRRWLLDDGDFNHGALGDPLLAETLAPWQAELHAHGAEMIASGHSRAQWLVWHGLFHDVGKPSRCTQVVEDGGVRIRFHGHEEASADLAARRVEALHFSRREVQIVRRVAEAHMRPHHLATSFRDGAVSRRAAYRFFRDTGRSGLGDRTGVDVLLLAIADRQAMGPERDERWRAFLRVVGALLDFALGSGPVRQQPLVDGRLLMQRLDLRPGPRLGRLLDRIAEAQAVGEIATPEEALALAAEMVRDEQ